MKTQESIYTQHEENSEWISKLKFYTDEISIIKNRLIIFHTWVFT